MDEAALRQTLEAVRSGQLHPNDALASLRRLPFADLGFAKVDHHWALRRGLPEAVDGPGKAPEQAAATGLAVGIDNGNGDACAVLRMPL